MVTTSKTDITSEADIDKLVKHFYDLVVPDSIIGFIFTDIAKIDLEEHLPKISRFWQKLLLGDNRYQGKTFEIHQQIHHQAELTPHHFHRWLFLFNHSVDTLFSGTIADLAKSRAKAIADSMLNGLQDRHMRAVLERRENAGLSFYDPKNQ